MKELKEDCRFFSHRKSDEDAWRTRIQNATEEECSSKFFVAGKFAKKCQESGVKIVLFVNFVNVADELHKYLNQINMRLVF